jgi:hypothetical protein
MFEEPEQCMFVRCSYKTNIFSPEMITEVHQFSILIFSVGKNVVMNDFHQLLLLAT